MQSFLNWRSELSLETVFGNTEAYQYPSIDGQYAYFLRQTAQGHNQLVRTGLARQSQASSAESHRQDHKLEQVSPNGFNVKTRINEYGGKPYRLSDYGVLMVNDMDRQLYCLDHERLDQASSEPSKVAFLSQTDDLGEVAGYGDFQFVDQDWLVSIIDRKPSQNSSEHTMSIEAARVGGQAGQALAQVLMTGADFYSNLVVSPNGKSLAWVQWNHPHMPWDDTQLFVASLLVEQGELRIDKVSQVGFSKTASICQLEFADDSRLCFAADFSNAQDPCEDFSNLYALDLSDPDSLPQRLSDFKAEFAYPHWQYTDARIKRLESGVLIAILSHSDQDNLVRIDLKKGIAQAQIELVQTGQGKSWFQSIDSNSQGDFIVRHFSDCQLVKLSVSNAGNLSDLIRQENPVETASVSTAEHFQYPTRDGQQAYAYFYAPRNVSEVAAVADLPPLIVLVHGGPTARAYGFFDLQKQFWTSNGFAVLDVNHRGSNGYGRAFRDALYERWGVIDTDDVVDAVDYLIEQQKVNQRGVLIRGKSAGGYAVLSALTRYSDVFCAGASYYGIGNLVTLCELTHKFEKYYTDRLVGEDYDAKTSAAKQSRFYQRSPLNFVNKIQCPLIIFQGGDDKVVPPKLAQEMVQALDANDVANHYFEYKNEGHGFRKAETNIDAWQKELNFYREVLNRESN